MLPDYQPEGIFLRNLLTVAFILALGTGSALAQPGTLTTDIWVDNWFAMYANGEKVVEDSVPITTERSFNAETATFSADFPLTIAIIAKDFKENDTGLEYIGTRRQQAGDGGMIAQFRDAATGDVLAVSNNSMRCLVVHHAPVDLTCAKESNPIAGVGACDFVQTEIPVDWAASDFDDSAWPAAVEHSEREVGPKDGYDRVDWGRDAKLVWSNDLVRDNTLLCRMTIRK